MHPLAQGARRMMAAPDALEWAEAAGEAIDALVAGSSRHGNAEVARDRLRAAIVGLYEHSRLYAGLPAAQDWIERTRRRLRAHAVAVLGDHAWEAVPPPHTEPLEAPSRGSAPRSMFGF